jgi:regulator of RNase E activity RraA
LAVCGGVSVGPGDVVVGNRDGIVVVSEAELLALLPRAEEVQRTEARVMERLGRGDPLLDMLNLAEHGAALREGKPSRLRLQP